MRMPAWKETRPSATFMFSPPKPSSSWIFPRSSPNMVQVLFQTVLTSLKGLIVSPKPLGIRKSTKYETRFQLVKEAPLILFKIIKNHFLFLNLSQTV